MQTFTIPATESDTSTNDTKSTKGKKGKSKKSTKDSNHSNGNKVMEQKVLLNMLSLYDEYGQELPEPITSNDYLSTALKSHKPKHSAVNNSSSSSSALNLSDANVALLKIPMHNRIISSSNIPTPVPVSVTVQDIKLETSQQPQQQLQTEVSAALKWWGIRPEPLLVSEIDRREEVRRTELERYEAERVRLERENQKRETMMFAKEDSRTIEREHQEQQKLEAQAKRDLQERQDAEARRREQHVDKQHQQKQLQQQQRAQNHSINKHASDARPLPPPPSSAHGSRPLPPASSGCRGDGHDYDRPPPLPSSGTRDTRSDSRGVSNRDSRGSSRDRSYGHSGRDEGRRDSRGDSYGREDRIDRVASSADDVRRGSSGEKRDLSHHRSASVGDHDDRKSTKKARSHDDRFDSADHRRTSGQGETDPLVSPSKKKLSRSKDGDQHKDKKKSHRKDSKKDDNKDKDSRKSGHKSSSHKASSHQESAHKEPPRRDENISHSGKKHPGIDDRGSHSHRPVVKPDLRDIRYDDRYDSRHDDRYSDRCQDEHFSHPSDRRPVEPYPEPRREGHHSGSDRYDDRYREQQQPRYDDRRRDDYIPDSRDSRYRDNYRR